MRIFMLILMVLGTLGGMGLGGLTASNLSDADAKEKLVKQIDQIKKMSGADSPMVKKAEAALVNVDGVITAAYGGLLIAVLSLLVFILTFAKKSKPLLVVGALTIVGAIAFILISPSFDTGKYGPANAQQMAMLYGIPALIGAFAGIMADKFRKA